MVASDDPVWEQWPAGGRVGVLRCGKAEGQYVLLVADTHQETWALYCQPPFQTFQYEGEIFTFDNYDIPTSFLNSLLRAWCVEWLPDGEDALIEPSVFDLREHWPTTIKGGRWASIKRLLGREGRGRQR